MTEPVTLPSWVFCWRNGVAPCLSTENLVNLHKALVTNDPRLLQGATCMPPPLMCVADWPVEAACPLGYVGAMGLGGMIALTSDDYDRKSGQCKRSVDGFATVRQVEEFFAEKCFEIDNTLDEPAGCRYFLNWWDDTPREQAIAALLGEVERTLLERIPQTEDANEPV